MAKRPDASVPGIIIIDKPSGMTSHDVVSRVRRLARTRKVGHGGTLDPMATGVLVVGVGKATRLLTFITGHSKTYEATIRFGASTSTDDAEGELIEARGCAGLPLDALESAMDRLRGEIDQVPSSVSAKKVDGKRAYELVRAGVEVELKANRVTVSRFDRCSEARPAVLHTADGPIPVLDLDVVVDCSSGTYIRALARDLGDMLGVGAHLVRLRRTRVGSFTLDDCRSLDSLEARAPKDEGIGEGPAPAPGLIGLDEAVRAMFPTLVLDEEEAGRFVHGNPPKRSGDDVEALLAAHPSRGASGSGGAAVPTGSAPGGQTERILGAADPSGRVLGLLDASAPRLRTICVFYGGER